MWEQSLIGLSCVSAAMSAALGIVFWWVTHCTPVLKAGVHPLDDEPNISVIIPARNEQDDIEVSLRSVLAQQQVRLEVIVVNDHSTDRTGEIVDSIAQSDERVKVIHNPPLPDGWLGKVNAMQRALDQATKEWLVFSDADVLHQPTCFASAWKAARDHQIDLLSLGPLWICESFWENALLPHCMVAGSIQFFPPSVNRKDSGRGAAAGAFIMTQRRVMEQLDGLAAIKTEMLDDIALGCLVKRHGFNGQFWLAPTLLSVRMFKDNHHAFWGLTKNILGSVKRISLAVPAMFLPVFVYWIPLVTLGIGIRNESGPMIVAGALPYAIQLFIVQLSTRICSIRWAKAIFFPAAVAPIFCCLASALWYRLFRGSIAWRGRVVSVSE